MNILQKIVRAIDEISSFAAKIALIFIFGLMLVMVYEVIMRYIFNAPTIWAMEISGYFMTVFIALGGAYVLKENAHINVDILYLHLSTRGKAVLDSFTAVVFFLFIYFFFALASKQAIVSTREMHLSGTIWNPPIWPIKILVAVGVGLILLQGIGKFIRDVTLAVTGMSIDKTVPEDRESL